MFDIVITLANVSKTLLLGLIRFIVYLCFRPPIPAPRCVSLFRKVTP